MSKALSLDLRERVLAAIAGGMSGRQAALRFGVSATSPSRWRMLERKQGDAKPGPLGGDRRSKRIEAHAEVILALVDETRDMTLEELRAALADQGLEFGYGTLWRFRSSDLRSEGRSSGRPVPSETACSLEFSPPFVRPIRRGTSPPFCKLAAVRWALRCVLSIIRQSGGSSSATKFEKIRANTPMRDQRANLLYKVLCGP